MNNTELLSLVKRLQSENIYTRCRALKKLGEQREARVVEPIAALLSDPNAEVYVAAVNTLEKIGNLAAIKILVQALVEEGRYFHDDYEPGIHSSEFPQRALQRIGAPAIPELLSALYNDAWIGHRRNGRWRAAWTLGQMADQAAVVGLVQALRDGGDDIRPSVAYALQHIGTAEAHAALKHHALQTSRQEAPIASGKHGRFYWIQSAIPSFLLYDLILHIPSLLLGRYIVITSFDSGLYQPTHKQITLGWQNIGGFAYSPKISDIYTVPHNEYDEWYIFRDYTLLHKYEVFVNYSNFSLRNDDDLTRRFWQQLVDLNPESYIAEGTDLFCITQSEELYQAVHHWLHK